MKPLFRWVGGKRSIAKAVSESIHKYLSHTHGTYHEPFLGGGAVAWELRTRSYTHSMCLSDTCLPLINMYLCVQEDPKRVFDSLCEYKKDCGEITYKKVRREPPLDRFQLAGWFLYITAMSFNGIWRLNKKGHFNVPWNKKGSATSFVTLQQLIEFQKEIQYCTHLECIDYKTALIKPRKGDFVFVDSPYANTFTGYSGDGFSLNDQTELARLLETLMSQGVHFMATNTDCPEIRSLYGFAHIASIKERRSVNREGSGRGKVKCLLISSSTKLLESV